jgi:two-component system, OmpR family, response regulator
MDAGPAFAEDQEGGAVDSSLTAKTKQTSGGLPLGLRVLVVEDYPDTATSTALLLKLFGHEVDVAGDGPTALRAAAAFPPDVVLLDIGLPGMDGYEVARRLRGQPLARRPFFIAVSGYRQPADRRREVEAGIDMHLLKPVDPDHLRLLLQRFLHILRG